MSLNSVRGKVVVGSKNPSKHHRPDGTEVRAASVTLGGVYKSMPPGPNGEHVPGNSEAENAMFGDATPCLNVSMFITNEQAHEFFKAGRHYYVTFTECAEEDQPVAQA